MTREKIKLKIVEMVISNQGMKATDFISIRAPLVDIANSEIIVRLVENHEILDDLIEELIMEGEISEVKYTLPNFPYRVKSFLLPGKTLIRYRTADEVSTEFVVNS